jgi:hypothetical protein
VRSAHSATSRTDVTVDSGNGSGGPTSQHQPLGARRGDGVCPASQEMNAQRTGATAATSNGPASIGMAAFGERVTKQTCAGGSLLQARMMDMAREPPMNESTRDRRSPSCARRCPDLAIRGRKDARSHRAGEPPNPSEERALLAGVSAMAAVTGQTRIHASTVRRVASRSRPVKWRGPLTATARSDSLSTVRARLTTFWPRRTL